MKQILVIGNAIVLTLGMPGKHLKIRSSGISEYSEYWV